MKDVSLRQIYLYLVSFVSLMLLIAGLYQTVLAAADFLIPEVYYQPGPAEIYARYKGPGRDQSIPDEIIEEQIRFEREQTRLNYLAGRYSNLKRAVAYVVVALPVWLYHWSKIQRESAGRPPQKGGES